MAAIVVKRGANDERDEVSLEWPFPVSIEQNDPNAGDIFATAARLGLILPYGRYNATPTTRTEGQLGPIQAGSKGSLSVSLLDKDGTAASLAAAAAAAAGTAYPTTTIVRSVPMLDNTATLDPQQGNTQGTLLASAARVASAASAAQTNYNARGVLILLNITVVPGAAETLTPYVDVQDPISGNWITYSVLPTGAKPGSTPGSWKFIVYPSTMAVTDLYSSAADFRNVVQAPLPRTWRLSVLHSASSSWTYSASYAYIL